MTIIKAAFHFRSQHAHRHNYYCFFGNCCSSPLFSYQSRLSGVNAANTCVHASDSQLALQNKRPEERKEIQNLSNLYPN